MEMAVTTRTSLAVSESLEILCLYCLPPRPLIFRDIPLERRGLFSHIKGDIALKIYAVHDGNRHPPPSTNAGNFETQASPVFQEINTNKLHAEDVMDDHEKKSKKKNKDKEVRTFHSIGTATGGPAAAAPPPVSSGFGFGFETHFHERKGSYSRVKN
ncbi:hypothetical protein OIU84_027157 [Salix udensis]|uniref:Uncharacterized protein n=1 Tax=Salix udensis TaxID=889485 RepID=A0AAD6PAJ6_9ROSI|nr:hypothetical protein OIU84_027157 [Salix udensis]